MLKLRRRCNGALDDPGSASRVLILSASMGAGHDGAAKELAARIERAGHEAEVRDFLDAAPLHLGPAVRRIYELELRHAPGAYDRTYQLWYRVPWLCPLVTWLVCFLTRRRVRRWVRRSRASAVVSTYPLATLCLGRLRDTGRLRVPAINFITDFGVHPLWVHGGIDIHLAVHAIAAEEARRRTSRPAIACGPLVADRFTLRRREQLRADRRRELGLAATDRAVLVVAGSWGVGDLAETFDAVAGAGEFVPVVVCGRDEATRARLERIAEERGTRAVVLGWTSEMPELMAACDALVENAGGLTSLEALRVGLPVVSYRPIAGHGKANTSMMAASGVSRAAADRDELRRCLVAVTGPGPERAALVEAGERMFVSDGSAVVLAATTPAGQAALPRPRRLRVAWSSTCRAVTGIAAAAALTWGGLTTGVGVMAAWGAGVAQPPANSGPVAYIGVRLDADEVLDPAVDREVRSLGVTMVLDRATAFAAPTQLRLLADEGVDIENGGRGCWLNPDGGPSSPELWTRAEGDVGAGRAIASITGRPVQFFVPARTVNAFDLIDAAHAHLHVVVPNVFVHIALLGRDPARQIPVPRSRQIWLVDGRGVAPATLIAVLERLQAELTRAQLTAVPIAALA